MRSVALLSEDTKAKSVISAPAIHNPKSITAPLSMIAPRLAKHGS
jgi:hypothetical protein